MEQFASFLEEGRNSRDEKQELVSRKEMDSVTEGVLSGVLNLELLVWGPELSFWRHMNSVKSSIKTMGERAFSRIFEKRLGEVLPPTGGAPTGSFGREQPGRQPLDWGGWVFTYKHILVRSLGHSSGDCGSLASYSG